MVVVINLLNFHFDTKPVFILHHEESVRFLFISKKNRDSASSYKGPLGSGRVQKSPESVRFLFIRKENRDSASSYKGPLGSGRVQKSPEWFAKVREGLVGSSRVRVVWEGPDEFGKVRTVW